MTEETTHRDPRDQQRPEQDPETEKLRRQRRFAWIAACILPAFNALQAGVIFFSKMIAEGDASTWWALGAAVNTATFLVFLFWAVAVLRGGSDQLPGWPTRIILSAAIAVVVTATLMTAFWIIAENAGYPLRL